MSARRPRRITFTVREPSSHDVLDRVMVWARDEAKRLGGIEPDKVTVAGALMHAADVVTRQAARDARTALLRAAADGDLRIAKEEDDAHDSG